MASRLVASRPRTIHRWTPSGRTCTTVAGVRRIGPDSLHGTSRRHSTSKAVDPLRLGQDTCDIGRAQPSLTDTLGWRGPGMPIEQTDHSSRRKRLRLWPGIAFAALLVCFHLAVPLLGPAGPPLRFLGGLVGGLLILLWWVFFSRAPWSERIGAIALMAVATLVTSRFLHISIGDPGKGPLFPILAIPATSVALVAWAVATARLSDRVRRASLIATICGRLFCLDAAAHRRLHRRRRVGASLAMDTEPGIPAAGTCNHTGDAGTRADNARRARSRVRTDVGAGDRPAVEPRPAPAATREPTSVAVPEEPDVTLAAWPGFRGPARDGVVRAVTIATNWEASPPVEMSASAGRPRLVVLCGPRRSALHPGTARRRGGRCVLQPAHRRADLAASRRRAVLGDGRRSRSARDTDARQRPRLHVRCDGNPQRSRRPEWSGRVVAQSRR